MCGRYTLAPDADELVEAFDLRELTFDFTPRYNIAPGQLAPVLAEDRRGRRMGLLKWGLVPSWRDEPKSPLINARGESVRTKASFRESFQRRRCLVPADGFYEWRREGDRKVPFWFHHRSGELVSFAGIWDRWERPGQPPGSTFAIVTTGANEDVRRVHDRMPVVVQRSDRNLWLSRSSGLDEVESLIHSAPDGTFDCRPVSTRVNGVGEDDAGLIEPVTGPGDSG